MSGLLQLQDQSCASSLHYYRQNAHPAAAFYGIATTLFDIKSYCSPRTVFSTLKNVIESQGASNDQITHSRCIQAALRARDAINDTLVTPAKLREELTITFLNATSSKFAKGMAQYGLAILNAYAQPGTAVTPDVFNQLKSVQENCELPEKVRANAHFGMAKMRYFGDVTNEKMTDNEAFQAFDIISQSSAAFPSYRIHSHYWKAMLRVEERVDDTYMTKEQAFDAFYIFCNMPNIKQQYVPFAKLEIAKLRVTNSVNDHRLTDQVAAKILIDFYDTAVEERVIERNTALFYLYLLHIQNRVRLNHQTDEVIFDRVLKISQIAKMPPKICVEASFILAILRCRDRVQDDRLTHEEAYDYLLTAGDALGSNHQLRQWCNFWRASLRIKGQINRDKLSLATAYALLDDFIRTPNVDPIWATEARRLRTSLETT